MGNYCMTVRGVGAHHNKKYESDANRRLAVFVKELIAGGHSIESATITFGGEDVICGGGKTPESYLASRDSSESA